MEKVTVRARTRGRSAQLFNFEAYGKLTERAVMTAGKDENGKEKNVPLLDENGQPVMVDDIDARGITSNLSDVIQAYTQELTSGFLAKRDEQGEIVKQSPEDIKAQAHQAIIDGAISWLNELARDAASPATSVEAKEDELSSIVSELIAAGILSEAREVIGKDGKPKLYTEKDLKGKDGKVKTPELLGKPITVDEVSVWRRNVTTGAKDLEVSRLEYAEMTSAVKKLRKMAPATV